MLGRACILYSVSSVYQIILHCFTTGLVDTAVKTAETGYMQRRLVKVQ